jgi:ribosomal protein L37AE/L43A
MARNKVQFQKGLSEAEFDRLYGTEEQCRAVVIAARWPNGFSCPPCGGRSHSQVATRGLFQCTKCRRQTSPIAGTIFGSDRADCENAFDELKSQWGWGGFTTQDLERCRLLAGTVLRKTAEQFDRLEKWYRTLSEALRHFLKGRQLQPPLRLNPG